MADKKGRAMIGHQPEGRCIASFTDQFAFTHVEKFASEGEALRWVSKEAERHGVLEEDITWIPSKPDA